MPAVFISVAWQNLSGLIDEAVEVSQAYTDEDARNELGDILPEEGGLPVACGAPCQYEPSRWEASDVGIECEFSFPDRASNWAKRTECSLADRGNTRFKRKRALKRGKWNEKTKELKREARREAARSTVIQADCFLRDFNVSADQLTAGPSLTPGAFPMALEHIYAQEYHVIKWDGRYARWCYQAPRRRFIVTIGRRSQ